MTEASIERPANQELFQTAPADDSATTGIDGHLSLGDSCSSKLRKDSIQNAVGMRIQVRKANSNNLDGFDGFQLSQEEIESDKGMLLETATEDINKYLLD